MAISRSQRHGVLARAMRAGLVAALIGCGCTACGYIDLRRAMDLVRSEYATIQGTVEGYSPEPRPIVVALWNADEPNRGVLRFDFLQGRGSFRFVVQAPGRYQVMAFEDLNEDIAFQPGEPAGMYRAPSPIDVHPGETVSGVAVRIEAPGAVPIPLKVDIDPKTAADTASELRYYQIGRVTSLEDPRFTATNARAGQWIPLEFVRDTGMGLYLLEPYAPGKVPLLFVHGSGGNPTDFRFLIERIDRSRYQPWVYFYPTGMRLERQSELLYKIVAILHSQLEFRQMALLSHSMGGLVMRGFLAEAARNSSPIEFPVFISLSAPWQGHAGAGKGVERSPAVVPAWRDMAPASRFLSELWETALPAETAYFLLFGYNGGFSWMIDRNNDGAVSIASQLDPRAQSAARRMFGFDEDHGSILTSPGVSETVNAILGGRAPSPWKDRKED
jgi:pimeloyl-ACP methyl ester carboxylesterase